MSDNRTLEVEPVVIAVGAAYVAFLLSLIIWLAV